MEKDLQGKISIKVHSGEDENQNFLLPEFMKNIVDYLNFYFFNFDKLKI